MLQIYLICRQVLIIISVLHIDPLLLQVVYTVWDENLLNWYKNIKACNYITFTCQMCEIIKLRKESIRRAK